jgi:uncharacterized protein (TIGR03118 family)
MSASNFFIFWRAAMKKSSRELAPFALGVICIVAVAACGGGGGTSSITSDPPAASSFTDTALAADNTTVVATVTTIDANLQNPWGIAVGPGLPFWIADNHSDLSTLYSGSGQNETSTITGSNAVGIAIPASAAGVESKPTGQVYNGTGSFLIPTPNGQETALFIFDGEAGTIAAWAQDSGATAATAYDDGIANGAQHAVYKGLALATVNGATYLYATDFFNNKVDVFDTTFAKPAAMQGKFIDPTIPSGFVPFNIAAVDGQLYVTFAMQSANKIGEVTGAGLGYVDVFDLSGNFVSRFASAGALNAPWGIAVAPSGFGSIAGDVLIGNFGDGTINIFMPNGSLATDMGQLAVANGGTFTIPGLWALEFGNGDSDKPLTTLFYTAGFADQTDGVFGSIAPSAASSSTPPPNPY